MVRGMNAIVDAWSDKVMRWAMRDLDRGADAVASVRRLVARSRRHEDGLVIALGRFAARLHEADRSADALATLAEAVEISRRRMVDEPAKFAPPLAALLWQRSNIEAQLGQQDEALAAAEESVELFRRLLRVDSARFEPRFAGAMGQLGRCLRASDRLEDAVAVAEHVLQIERRLTTDRPESREPNLAEALHNLGAYQLELGRFADGLRATDEAIQLRGRLAADDPGTHESDLAGAVRNRDRCLARLAESGKVVLGPYPLCAQCEKVNGGLVAVRHRQVHVRANGRESCVDQGLARIIVDLWAVCGTTTCCEDDGGRAYVVPAAGQLAAAEELLTSQGIPVEREHGVLYFRLPVPKPGEDRRH